jgi:hypothetical protein
VLTLFLPAIYERVRLEQKTVASFVRSLCALDAVFAVPIQIKDPAAKSRERKKEATTGKIILGTHFILLGAREEEAAGRSVRGGGSFHLPQVRAPQSEKKETKTPTLYQQK